jgi:hypothetical protein
MPRKNTQVPSYLAAQTRINQALTDGVGGIQFTVQSPPGVGRLIRIPFYLTQGTSGFAALLASGETPVQVLNSLTGVATIGSSSEPLIAAGPPGAAGAGFTATLFTPQISWATLRVVGFEASVAGATVPSAPVAQLGFAALEIGGGANLFVHEDFAPADIYLDSQPSLAGLRDYPLLKSPNVAQVLVQNVGAVASDILIFSANLICEILVDDQYGAHIPSPAARPGALVRQGGAFVSR